MEVLRVAASTVKDRKQQFQTAISLLAMAQLRLDEEQSAVIPKAPKVKSRPNPNRMPMQEPEVTKVENKVQSSNSPIDSQTDSKG